MFPVNTPVNSSTSQSRAFLGYFHKVEESNKTDKKRIKINIVEIWFLDKTNMIFKTFGKIMKKIKREKA